MQILVTGVAGFIGFHLAQKLLSRNVTVVGIDNLNRAYNTALKKNRLKLLTHYPRFNYYHMDILHPRSLTAVFKKNRISTVYHLAARTGVRTSIRYPSLYRRVNVGGTETMYILAHRFGVQHFIFSSSSSVYGNSQTPFNETVQLPSPTSPYAASKQVAEKLLKKLQLKYQIPTTIFRFFSVYGPLGRPDMAPYLFTEAILNERPLSLLGSGKEARDFTYIDDIVHGLILVLNKRYPFEIINLGNHQPTTISNLIYTIAALTRKKALVQQKPRRKEEVKTTWADITKAKKLLGWQPKTSLVDGMSQFVAWYKKTHWA